MNIKINSAELNRMMKTVSQCVDERNQKFGNIEISTHDNNLYIRGTNGQFAAVTFSPLLGADDEAFCVDGTMFAKVCAMCNGDVTITTDNKFCTIKGAGRTRLPIINADVPPFKPVDSGTPTVTVKADDFSIAYASVLHAISNDQSRIQLTGVLTEVDDTGLRMTALDGFRMSVETIDCDGDRMKIIVPGAFMKLIQSSTSGSETITIVTDGSRIEASTDGMRITCGLLSGEFPAVARIVPIEFSTECLVKIKQVQSALRGSSVLNSKNNLVKLSVEDNALIIKSNSEEADYEERIDCETRGDGLNIAFNQKYLTETFASINDEEAIMKFNKSTTPCVIFGKQANGHSFRLVLPVRVMG